MIPRDHNLWIGYLLWVFGFTGAHRFYFGKPITGSLYFLVFSFLGLSLILSFLLFPITIPVAIVFGIFWILDLFLMPQLAREANVRFHEGGVNYNLAWIFLTFLGVFGVHRLYMAKFLTGILYLFTGGLFFIGVLYDYWTLNKQIDEINQRYPAQPA